MTTSHSSVGFWSEAAGRWVNDEERVELIGRVPGRIAMDRLGLQPGLRVLDVGCGLGATTVELANRTSPGGVAVGVDASPTMLDAARNRTAPPAVKFVHADAQRMLLDPASYDRVFSRFGAMFFDDAIAAFANLRRGLRTDGRLAIVSWQAIEHNDWMRLPAAAASDVLDAPVALPQPDRPGPFSLCDPERIRASLDAAGFHAIDITPHNDHVEVPVSDVMAFAAGSMGHGGIRAALRQADTEQRVLQAIADRLLRHAADNGVIRLRRGVHIVVARP